MPRCFNGAVLCQHGRRPGISRGRRSFWASMGPCFVSTEGLSGLLMMGAGPRASMGPCLVSTDGFVSTNGPGRIGGFNGAVLCQHGRPAYLRYQPTFPQASMGPCFVSTEGEENRIEAR